MFETDLFTLNRNTRKVIEGNATVFELEVTSASRPVLHGRLCEWYLSFMYQIVEKPK
jgi:hypothetical protein